MARMFQPASRGSPEHKLFAQPLTNVFIGVRTQNIVRQHNAQPARPDAETVLLFLTPIPLTARSCALEQVQSGPMQKSLPGRGANQMADSSRLHRMTQAKCQDSLRNREVHPCSGCCYVRLRSGAYQSSRSWSSDRFSQCREACRKQIREIVCPMLELFVPQNEATRRGSALTRKMDRESTDWREAAQSRRSFHTIRRSKILTHSRPDCAAKHLLEGAPL